MQSTIDQIRQALLDSPLGGIPAANQLLASALDLLIGPLTAPGSAFYVPWLLAGIAVAFLVFVLETRGTGGFGTRAFFRYCFPRSLYAHPSTRTDIKLIVVNKLLSPFINVTWRLNAAFFTGALLSGMVALFGAPLGLFEWNFTALLVVTLLAALAEDFGFYLCHLAHHRIPALWAFHKVHHSAEVLTPLTATRNHPVEFFLIAPSMALTGALFMAPILFLFDTAPTLIELFGVNLVLVVTQGIGGKLFHSHIWLTWPAGLQRFLLCPAQHQIHHSSAPRHHDKNMAGIFAFWDWIFGTLYVAPPQREEFSYGVYGDAKQAHPGLIAAYLVPLWEAIPNHKALRRRLSRGAAPPIAAMGRFAGQGAAAPKPPGAA
ncbi:MAG: fatty acid hydroxylase [Belnapia sp.]|nr:fatty acid hydroxylase [Belnapia sp.]